MTMSGPTTTMTQAPTVNLTIAKTMTTIKDIEPESR